MKKYAPKFQCLKCDYKCSSKFLWDQHCSTQKHKRQHLATLGNAKYVPYICEGCGREYKQRSGLWRHRKKCSGDTDHGNNEVLTLATENKDLKQLMQQMLSGLNKEGEIKDQMINQLQAQNKIIQDMIPKLGNNNNNKFNINVFLNEDCRDAINMSEFIESLQIQLEDLNFTKKFGLIDGVSSIFVKGLKQLETTRRPIHCTDTKRDILYIKDNNTWDKGYGREKLKDAINDIAAKQRDAISDWEKANPDWSSTETGKDEYIQLVKSVMSDVDNHPNENKIIKIIAKETTIDK